MRPDWYRRIVDAALPEPDARRPWCPIGCAVDCLHGDTPPTVSPLLRLVRLVALGVCFAATLCLALIARPGGRLAHWTARAGSRAGLVAMGITVRRSPATIHAARHGLHRPKGVLVVSGHVSWIDILVLQAACGPMRMLAMNELAAWPILGWLSRRVGTVFIDRDRLLALPGTVAELAAVLRAGDVVGAFPEGITTCGRHPLAWRPAVFQAAIDADAEILVVRLAYRAAGKPTGHVALLRREVAWTSLWRGLKLRHLTAELSWDWLTHVDSVPTRRALAAAATALAAPSGGAECPSGASAR